MIPTDRDLDQNRAMDMAAPILVDLYNILDNAVALYFGKDYTPLARAEHTSRAMANCIYAHAEKGMIRVADSKTGLHAINVRGLHVINYRDQILVRFKKVTANGRHSNYQTEQQEDYDDQKHFEEFPDPAIRLTAGYQLDVAGSALERIMIARPIGRTIFWASQVSVLDNIASWEDITPERIAGTGPIDFDAERARRNRRGK